MRPRSSSHRSSVSCALGTCAVWALVSLVSLTGCGSLGDSDAGAANDGSGAHRGRRGALVFVVEEPRFREGASSFDVAIESAEGAAVAGAELAIRAIMPSMGHEPTYDAIVSETEPGHYEVTDLVLDMPGEWEVRIHAEAGNLEDDVSFLVEAR